MGKEKKTEIESKPKEANKESVQDPKKIESIENVTTPVSTPKKILETGQVLITVFKARDIEKKGKFGKADPYVKMTLGKQKAKSATVKNNHNPEWNFKASFDINESTTNEVSIAVFDEDFGKDDTQKSSEITIQETHIEQGETETLVKKETQIETSTKKGGKGLKEVLDKEKKVSSEVIVQSGQSMEPE